MFDRRWVMRRGLWAILVLFAVDAAAVESRIASDGMLEADGRRIFVIGLYENPDDDAVLEAVAQAGFNLVRASCNAESLDRLRAHGLYGWVNTGHSIDLGPAGDKPDAGLRDMAAGCGQHPALLVWEVPDEALWNCWLKGWRSGGPLAERCAIFREAADALAPGMAAGRERLRELDPAHPVWINHAAGNSVADLAAFNQAADIVGCDIYPLMPDPTPIVDISRKMLGVVGVCTARMQSAAPGKPVWMVLQGTGWRDMSDLFGPKRPGAQRPTFDESRFMAYDAIVRGARGILYWGTHNIEKNMPFWHELLALARELADAQPMLSAPDADLPFEATAKIGFFPLESTVFARGKAAGDRPSWIVVNETPIPCRYELSGLDPLEGVEYAEKRSGRQTKVARGRIEGPIDAYGALILEPVAR